MTAYQSFSTTSVACPKCDSNFIPQDSRQRYCSRQCSRNSARTYQRATYSIDFIGVDGEGINIVANGAKEHRYVMLSVGDETLWNNGEELTHTDIFPFLYRCFLDNPSAAFVGFYLGYDFTNWLKSLPEERARMLFYGASRRKRRGANPVPFPVYVDGWEIDILGLRRFKLRPASLPNTKPHRWLYICDAGSYFQTAFLKVIDPENWPDDAPCTPEEFSQIKLGKEARGNEVVPGDTSYVTEMMLYNKLENKVLANVMRTLNQGFLAAGVKLQRDAFYGPGQAIQKWLDGLCKSGAYLLHKNLECVPTWVLDAFQASYYGGRFELAYHGLLPGATYEYDITSAYPHAMRSLPCLCSNNWLRGSGDSIPTDCDILLVHGNFATNQNVLGALPFRNQKGNILFPTNTSGWYLWSEIEAGISAGLIHSQRVDQWVAFKRACNHPPPLAPIGDLFYTRLKVGKTTAQGKAIKLLINSAYGKFAQSIGTPKYGNPIYASMITSECRRMILHAISTHPNGADAVVMIATDGVYFTTPHPILDALPDKEQLGGWESKIKHNVTLMKPGVYWDDKARAAVKRGQPAPIKSRGISAATLAFNMERLDNEFSKWRDTACTTNPPTLDVSVSFAITTPLLALARNKWGTCGHIEWDGRRTESATLNPKRINPYIKDGYIRSSSVTLLDGAESVPYQKAFGFERTTWGIDHEGELTDVIQAFIGD